MLFVWSTIQSKSLVTRSSPGTVTDAVRVKALGKTIYTTYFNQKRDAEIRLRIDDINAVLALLHRSSSERIAVIADIRESTLELKATIRLATESYINITGTVIPSNKGLHFGDVSIGWFRLKGELLIPFIQWVGDILLGKEQGGKLLNAVTKITLQEGLFIATIQPVEKLDKARLKRLREWIGFFSQQEADVHPEIVKVYYQYLNQHSPDLIKQQRYGLSDYLQLLFAYAEKRSAYNDPAVENNGALLALAIFLGDARLESVVGDVSMGLNRAAREANQYVVLAGREDLRLHFMISAALELLGNGGMSFAIGELKELMDAAKGGSGFSFVDLAADRAGIHLAILATHPDSASRVQALLAKGEGEAVFFPDISGLEEGLTEAEFTRKYNNTESDNYLVMLEEVDKRIAQTILLTNSEMQHKH